jgi:hypothetical protein
VTRTPAPSARRVAARACATLAAGALAGCATAPRAVAPRPITFACANVTPAAFAARGTALMRENGWTLREADSTRGIVRATRGPVYAGLGENLTVDGPYLFSTALAGGQAQVIVQSVEVHRHRLVPVENLDDRSRDADRRNYLPVLDGLRTACGAPTSGRTTEPRSQPQLPPPGGAR